MNRKRKNINNQLTLTNSKLVETIDVMAENDTEYRLTVQRSIDNQVLYVVRNLTTGKIVRGFEATSIIDFYLNTKDRLREPYDKGEALNEAYLSGEEEQLLSLLRM